MGFLVAAAVIVIYVFMITKAIYVAKTAKDDIRSKYCNWNCRDFDLPYDRKYRNDNGTVTNYGSSTSICKLWRKLTYYKLCMHWITLKY